MTREEIVDYLSIELQEEDPQIYLDLDDYKTILEALKSKWIPITERLPKEHERVLFTVIMLLRGGRTSSVTYYGTFHDDGFYHDNGVRTLGSVNAWQPLPEPYVEQSNN